MLCTNGHNNANDARFCASCGVDTFQAGTEAFNPEASAPAGAVGPANTEATIRAINSNSTNGLAIASMVLGILWLYGLGAILALVFGYVSRRQIKETGQRGSGMALAGIILGWIGVAGMVLFIVFAIALSNSTTNY